MNEVFRWFRFLPLAAGAVLLVAFVFRCRMGRLARGAWIAFLAAALLMFEGFVRWGGSVFRPELPEKLIWFWSVAYLGSLLLAALAVVTFFWRSRWKVWALPIVAYGIAALGLWNALKVPAVTEITLEYEDLPRELKDYRIVQISDLHACAASRGWRTRAIVQKVNALKPDLICLTGDIADGSPSDRCADVLPLKGLRAKDGVFAVSGNHEAFYDFAEWKKIYAGWGLRFLENACAFPRRSLALAGVNDDSLAKKGFAVPDITAAFSSATNGLFRVLLQHRPDSARENFSGQDLGLQLSGHTHGGFMPGLWHLTAECNRGFLRDNYPLGHGHLVVSSGCGPWPAFPFRYFTPSEIVLIRLGVKRVWKH